MKKLILCAIALLAITVALPTTSTAQNAPEKKISKAELRRQKKAQEEARQVFVIDSILKLHRFTFVADRALTSMADKGTYTINYRAYMTIDGTNIISSLPYYGRSDAATYGSSTSPLNFEAKDISYETGPMTNKKDGKAIVLVKARDSGSAKSFVIGIEIYNNGSATMAINISGGSGQTFYGYIEPITEEK